MPTFTPRHRWDVTPDDAITIQETLQREVITTDQLGDVRYVAGVDAGFETEDGQDFTRAAVALLSFPDLELQEQAIVRQPTLFPYVPGLLSFREGAAIIAALEQLATPPDIILCDSQGIAHPRRFGLACHIGILTNLPTIGVAKSRFIGTHNPPPPERGSWAPLQDSDEQIGAVLRTQTNIRPLYVSIGHKISLESAIHYVLACAPRYRLPETTRWADRLASRRA